MVENSEGPEQAASSSATAGGAPDGAIRGNPEDLADTSHDVRTLDLDMAGLEDKMKALSGRVSVRKRRDRQPEEAPEPELDLDMAIRDGVVTEWPQAI